MKTLREHFSELDRWAAGWWGPQTFEGESVIQDALAAFRFSLKIDARPTNEDHRLERALSDMARLACRYDPDHLAFRFMWAVWRDGVIHRFKIKRVEEAGP